jgi:hypothetical protein
MELEMEESALNDEISLLKSMYPDELAVDRNACQLVFKHQKGSLEIRLPNTYPFDALPELLTARGPKKHDLRAEVKGIFACQQIGEPCLDAIITEFIDLIESFPAQDDNGETTTHLEARSEEQKTTIVWLHHLLATGKRKQALSPEGSDSSRISGITKPGYPGVMIFSGPATAVEAHVQTLKHLRWQAFQIRCETTTAWSFAHGEGVIEVETMGEVVAEVEGNSKQKELFMEVMKIK